MSVPGGFRRLPSKSGEDRNAAVLLDCGPGTGSGPPRLLQTRRPSALSSLRGAARAYTSRLREDVAAPRHHTRPRRGLQHHPKVPRDGLARSVSGRAVSYGPICIQRVDRPRNALRDQRIGRYIRPAGTTAVEPVEWGFACLPIGPFTRCAGTRARARDDVSSSTSGFSPPGAPTSAGSCRRPVVSTVCPHR